ncbi:hypothetical protein C8T65DRAFT_697989 [Cerioporus squamosus]|nr:hypothetical protein C8T65DRAFT_697989 [Cerioporus squamosus]
MSPRSFTIHRAQGITRVHTGVNTGTGSATGRQSRLSHWSSSDSDDDSPPSLIPEPIADAFPPGPPPAQVTRVEQYLVLVVEGERISIEQTSRGFRPEVNVDFMNHVPGDTTFATTVWLLFAVQMEAVLMTEVDRAFRRVAAERAARP